jgi:hypothetical protein
LIAAAAAASSKIESTSAAAAVLVVCTFAFSSALALRQKFAAFISRPKC